MKEQRPAKWNRLDNAAKIFPPTSGKRDTKVFRFACELTEAVVPEILQMALDRTIELFPFYRSILKKGLFWYYLEETTISPKVAREYAPLCGPLYDQNSRSLLFDVTYYRNRINLEIYHALSDGTGALQFLRVLVYYYLLERHKEELGENPPSIDYDASMTQKSDDSFQKYYRKNETSLKKSNEQSYHFKGTHPPENRIQVIEGTMPVRAVIDKAHEYGATMTAFMAALFLCSISETMSLREKKRPVVLTIPVNLRQYFSSASARNFFSVFEVSYRFDEQSTDFQDVVSFVSEYFKKELTAQRMAIRMNALAAIEHNVFVRPVPRIIKDVVLKGANWATDRGISAALSNVGKVEMPKELCQYIRLFDVFVSTKRMQICMCSFGETLTVSFSSAFECSEVQMNFFRRLSGMGIPITIAANQMNE